MMLNPVRSAAPAISPKSRSNVTTMRPSAAALSKISRSGRFANPASSTCTASWPSERSRSAKAGGRFMPRRKRIEALSGRDYLFAGQPCRVGQRLTNVFVLQVGIVGKYPVPGEALGYKRHNQANRDPHPADAGAATHLSRLKGDPVQAPALRLNTFLSCVGVHALGR